MAGKTRMEDLHPDLSGVIDDHTAQLADIALNIKFFGAKGDGITDDTNAFVAARAVSRNIYVPDGEFIVENLTIDTARIFGPGTIKWKPNATHPMFNFTGKTVIRQVTLDGNKDNQVNDIIGVNLNQGRGSKLNNVKFQNFRYKVLMSGVADTDCVDVIAPEVENCGVSANCDIFTVRSSNWIFSNPRFTNIGDGHCIRVGLLGSDPTTNPVCNTLVEGGYFKTTQHNGVTCEIYSRDTKIINNEFDGLDQAIKCESAGNTVSGVIIEGNTFRNIALNTALNLAVPGVKFNNNKCYDMAGPYFGEYYECSHNEFYDCGTLTDPVIGDNSSAIYGKVDFNTIVNPKYKGIYSVSGKIAFNAIINCPDDAIRVSGDGANIESNTINGSVNGIVLVSTTTNAIIDKNNVSNISGTAFSHANNVNFNTCNVGDNNIGFEIGLLSFTIASDTITIGKSSKLIKIDSEGAASTDDLSTINGGTVGQVIIIKSSSVSRVITVKDKVGNIDLSGDFVLDATDDTLTLVWNGTYWCEIARSSN